MRGWYGPKVRTDLAESLIKLTSSLGICLADTLLRRLKTFSVTIKARPDHVNQHRWPFQSQDQAISTDFIFNKPHTADLSLSQISKTTICTVILHARLDMSLPFARDKVIQFMATALLGTLVPQDSAARGLEQYMPHPSPNAQPEFWQRVAPDAKQLFRKNTF